MGVMLGPFELLEPVARGGMAEVWRGLHRERDVPVAIKVITGDFAKDPAYLARFADEVRAVAALDHPGIVTILDHGRIDEPAETGSAGRLRAGTPWLAMEYCSHGTLSKVAMPLKWPRVRNVLLSTLDALAHAHARGVIHRDLKPPNVLLAGPRDLRPGFKLSDFGISWIGGEEQGTPLGTPRYMAPEQIQVQWRDYGPWTDLYSLGCVGWWLVVGNTPFRARRVADTLVGHLHRDPPFLDAQIAIPDGFEEWLRVLLAKKPRDRYQRAADAAHVLRSLGEPSDRAEWDKEEGPVTLNSTVVALSGKWDEVEDSQDVTNIHPRVAPMPADWRHRRVAPPPPALKGAGLSLFGLRQVPLVGRQEARDVLWQQLVRVHKTGNTHAVLISGPAGTGKSRLTEWFCQRAHEVGAAGIGIARFDRQQVPGTALHEMGRDYFRVQDMSREDVAARIDGWLGPLGASPEERMVLTEILQPVTEEDLAEGLPWVRLTNPRDYLGAISTTFRHLASERPMIAWLDDVQWGLHGLGLALQMLLVERPMPVLLVLTYRTEALELESAEARRIAKLISHENCEHIELSPLSSSEHRQLVEDLIGSLDRKLSARLRERTAGNPLFAVQLLGNWVNRGVLVAGDEGLVLAEGATAEIPDDVHGVWIQRIERELASFGPQARTYLEVAAVLGQTVERQEWRSACDDPQDFFGDRFPGDEPLRAAMVEQLLRVKLIVGTVERWSFVHEMLRESLERQAREAGRLQTHHLSCAQMLERRSGERSIDERLGRHLLAAGNPADALEPLLRGVATRRLTVGAEPALALLALAEEALAEAELEASDERIGRLEIERARILVDAGQQAEAEKAAERAMGWADEHGWTTIPLEAMAIRGEIRLNQRDHTNAEIDLVALRDLAEGTDHALRSGSASIGLAEVARNRGDYVAASARLEEALRALAEAGETAEARAEEAKAWRLLGRCAEAASDAEEARVRYEGARDRYDRIGYALGAADCLDRLGRIAADEGDLERAARLMGLALSRYEALGNERRFTCRLRLGLVRARAGDAAGAWDAVASVQQVGAHLDRKGNTALGHALRLVRASVDEDWTVWGNAFAQTAASLPRKGLAPGLVAWLGHIAGVITADKGQTGLARQALRASHAIWTMAGEVARAADVQVLLGSLDP